MNGPVGYVEVTVAMSFLQEDGTMLHDNMAEATAAYAIPTPSAPREFTDEETREIIRVNLSRVLAAITSGLIANGVKLLGEVDEPMTQHGRVIGTARSMPVTVRMVEEPEATPSRQVRRAAERERGRVS